MSPYPRTVCRECGVVSVRGPNYNRDYPPVRVLIHLKPEPRTTYVLTPELATLAVKLISLNGGADDYAVYFPLNSFHAAMRILDSDQRIRTWNTENTTDVCASHLAGQEWARGRFSGDATYLRPVVLATDAEIRAAVRGEANA